MSEKRRQPVARLLFGLFILLVIGALWSTNEVRPGNFVMEVPVFTHWQALETDWLYAFLMLFTIAFPLARSFEPRLDYRRKWRFLLPGGLVIAAIFIGWDIWFTKVGVWGFNDAYLTGFRPLGLPWEEWTFFIFVPFSCVFIHEALCFYIKRDLLAPVQQGLTILLAVLFFAIGVLKWESLYTSTTFLLCGFFNVYHLLFLKDQPRGRFYLSYLVSFLPFLLVNGALTGGFTHAPVVYYNPEEFFGVRIVSIPVDDAAYGYLLLMSNFTCYHYFKGRKPA